MAPKFLIAVIALALPLPALAEELKGKVVLVAEGDRLSIQQGDSTVTVQLRAVDCPEPGQPHADEARQLTSKHLLGKPVKISVEGKDPQGRPLGRVCPTTATDCLDEELLRAGLAWHDKAKDSRPELAALEKEARTARRGLWANPKAIAPWQWRKQHPAPLQGTMVGDARGHPAIDVSHPVCLDPATRTAHWFTCEQARGKNCPHQTPAAARAAGYQLHTCLTTQPPPADERTCRTHRDCTLRPLPPCGCKPCGQQQREAINRTTATRLTREHARERRTCPKVKCPHCPQPLRWLGTRALCQAGRCEVR